MAKYTKEQIEKAVTFCGLVLVPHVFWPEDNIASFNPNTGEVAYNQHGNNKLVKCMKRTLESATPKDEED